jgi:phage FluMu protein Com
MDAALRIVRETFDTHRLVRRSEDLVVDEVGPFNYHCAECGTLLIRHAGIQLPDVVVICPVCLSLNEPLPAEVSRLVH